MPVRSTDQLDATSHRNRPWRILARMATPAPCHTCGRITTAGTYCDEHRQTKQTRGYGGGWELTSKRLRRGKRCVICGTALDLTVDHPTLAVLCRSHHVRLEGLRRRMLRPDLTPAEAARHLR